MGDFENKVYIITGGASGFGLAMAKILVERGARVGLLGRRQAALDEAVSLLGKDRAFAVSADVANLEEVRTAFARIKDHFGQLNGVVNNAGTAAPSRVESQAPAAVIAQINTNLLGTILCCQAAIPLLVGEDNPRIVNVSSACAVHMDEMAHLSVYAATKAAVERFSRDLRLEVAAQGIGVSCLRPGSAPTNFAGHWDLAKFQEAMGVWFEQGTYTSVGMEAEHVGKAIADTLAYPQGVAIDLLEIRPNAPMAKRDFA